MPFIPDELFKNFVKPLVYETQLLTAGVKRVMAVPCDIDVSIWVETFADAALAAFYDVIEPDLKEVYHKVSGKSFICDVTSTMEQATKHLPNGGGPATRFLFQGLKVYDIATWWFFLADVAAEGAYKWTSGLYRQSMCPNQGSPNHGSGTAWGGGLQPNGAWHGMDFAYPVGSRFYPVAPSGLTVRAGSGYTCAFTAAWTLIPQPIVTTPCRMTYEEGGYLLDKYTNPGEGGASTKPTHVFTRGRNNTGEIMTITVEWQWFDPTFPPFTQVFPKTDMCHSFVSGLAP